MIFIFLLFLGTLMYANAVEIKEKYNLPELKNLQQHIHGHWILQVDAICWHKGFFIDSYRLTSEIDIHVWLISVTIDYYRVSVYLLTTSGSKRHLHWRTKEPNHKMLNEQSIVFLRDTEYFKTQRLHLKDLKCVTDECQIIFESFMGPVILSIRQKLDKQNLCRLFFMCYNVFVRTLITTTTLLTLPSTWRFQYQNNDKWKNWNKS